MSKNVFVFIISILIFNAIEAQIPTNDLIAYWPFSGNANDYSNNYNNGSVYFTTLVSDRCGVPNSAYSFNGYNSYISIPYSLQLNPIQEISISAWFKFNNFNEIQSLLANTHGAGYSILIYQGMVKPQIKFTNVWSAIGILTNFFNTSDWYHIVVTYDNVTLKTYINTVLINEELVNQDLTCSLDRPLFIGAEPKPDNTPDWFFNGLIDDVRLYSRAINIKEIIELYNECNLINISELSETNKIQIFPNPISDFLNIKLKEYLNDSEYSIKLYNDLGQEMLNKQIIQQETVLNLTSLIKGIYVLKIVNLNNQTIEQRKIILE